MIQERKQREIPPNQSKHMSETEIIKTNRLITKFRTPSVNDEKLANGFYDHIEYHKDWNELMPIIEKIGKLQIPKGWVSEPWTTDVSYSISKYCTMFTIGDNSLFITDSGNEYSGHKLTEWKNLDKTPL